MNPVEEGGDTFHWWTSFFWSWILVVFLKIFVTRLTKATVLMESIPLCLQKNMEKVLWMCGISL